MKYFVVVGEASGDMHASKLLEGILKNDPSADILFWGGDRMAAVVGKERMLSHYKEGAFMGIWEVAKNLKTVLGRIRRCKSEMLAFAPDVVILVDFAGFNLKIAKTAKAHGIRTFFYIAPKVWAWKESRAKKIKAYIDELFVIFPFEVEYFKKWGINAHFFGNPIVDEIRLKEGAIHSREVFLKDNQLSDKPIIALLAGSRKQEIEYNLPFMEAVAAKLPDHQFVLAAVPWLDRELYAKTLSGKSANLTVLFDQTYDILKHSEGAIVTSGTATLETALLGVPEIVCYKCSFLTFLVGKVLIKVKYISLVNIILNKAAVKELIYKEMTTENAVRELKAVLPAGTHHAALCEDYRTLRESMGPSGASERVAEKMVELLKTGK